MKFLKVLEVNMEGYFYQAEDRYIKVSNILSFKSVSFDNGDKRHLKTKITFNNAGEREYYFSKLTVDELLIGEVDSPIKEVTRFDLIDFED
jgi:hypothetical protein